MTLAFILIIAHFVGDFLLQSDWMALNKSKRWDALALHVVAYILALYAVLASSALLGAWSNPHASFDDHWFYVVNAALHFITDAITGRITSRLWFLPQVGQGMRPEWIQVEVKSTRHWFFVVIGADQVLHYAALFLTASWWLR